MYTDLRNVQILISLLKQHGVKHLVLSPGTRNVPFVHSIEQDSFFTCYSIVDERSAAYFALGLAAALDEPVGFSCTSSTASCNYLPAIKEAYESHIPLVAITADRDWRLLYQMEDQMISQKNMYGRYTRCSVSLPIVRDKNDIWFCIRKTNEALLEMDHHGKGPIQINFQVDDIGNFSINQLPTFRKIERLESGADLSNSRELLLNRKRILVLCGEYYSKSEKLIQFLRKFAEKFNTVVSYDYFSNLTDSAFLKTVLVTEAMDEQEFQQYLPDLVITFGGHVWSFIKYKLRRFGDRIEHWSITETGEVCDGFNALTRIFECAPEEFFGRITEEISAKNNLNYYHQWKKRIDSVKFPKLPFTNFSVIRDFTSRIPNGSLLHLSILNSVRLTNFNTIGDRVSCFGNLGADGIDGVLSTFIGQSAEENRLSFLIIGDLSFLYDLNASLIPMKNNQRILVINNFAGGEFHTNFGLNAIPSLNLHIAAGHHTKIVEWAEMMNAEYFRAKNQTELEKGLARFVMNDDRPMVFEVFTDANTDANTLKKFYQINQQKTVQQLFKSFIKKGLRRFGLFNIAKRILRRGK